MKVFKASRIIVSAVAAASMIGAIGFGHAQTTSNNPAGDMNRDSTTGVNRDSTRLNPDGTTGVNRDGTRMNPDGTTGVNRDGTRMNPDGTTGVNRTNRATGTAANDTGAMSRERVARADRN